MAKRSGEKGEKRFAGVLAKDRKKVDLCTPNSTAGGKRALKKSRRSREQKGAGEQLCFRFPRQRKLS